MLKDDNQRWKATMLFAALLAGDTELIRQGRENFEKAGGTVQEACDAFRAAADQIDPADHCIISEEGTGTPDQPDGRFHDWLVNNKRGHRCQYIQKLAFEIQMDDCVPDYSTSLKVWLDHLINHHDQDADGLYVSALKLAHIEWKESING